MAHEDLYDRAVEAIDRLFSDTSVSLFRTEAALKDLKNYIDIQIDALMIYEKCEL